MRTPSFPCFLLGLAIMGSILIHPSCQKTKEDNTEKEYLQFSIPRMELMHGLYYRMAHDERSIELEFNEGMNENTIAQNISLEDITGSIKDQYEIHVSGRKVLLTLKPGAAFRYGWKYQLHLGDGLRSVSGRGLEKRTTVEFRTLFHHPFIPSDGPEAPGYPDGRNSIACISDIHMGDARANTNHYCWFGENADALVDFLDFIVAGSQVRQLVILGDLFDEWLIPYSVAPFEGEVTDSRGYFLSVANNPINLTVMDRLKSIAQDPDLELIYVHGNHDMLLTEEILQEIIPGIVWAGDAEGLGHYSPLSNIIMEHGHRYDFFNCPQPLVNTGHMLPPGYFVSRLYAQGLMDEVSGLMKDMPAYQGSFEFLAAWEIAMLYTLVHLDMSIPDMTAANILMAGIDGYTNPFSFDGARDMYAANIEDEWDATQGGNLVPVNLGCCLMAIWNGHSDLFTAATEEYMLKPPAPKLFNVVAFGHTHQPMVKVFPDEGNYTSIYANSGSWVDPDESSYKVRTYLMITPSEWTGSELDVVSMYQYNLDTENGDVMYKPVFLAEENIDIAE